MKSNNENFGKGTSRAAKVRREKRIDKLVAVGAYSEKDALKYATMDPNKLPNRAYKVLYGNEPRRREVAESRPNNRRRRGSRGEISHDVRSAKPILLNMLMETATDSVAMSQDVDLSTYCAPILASLFDAVRAGVLTDEYFVKHPDSLAFAYRHACEVLKQVAIDGEMKMLEVPRWFNILLNAILPTQVKTAGGEITYTFDITGDPANQWLFPVGQDGAELNATLGVISPGSVTNTVLQEVIEPNWAVYNETEGQKALTLIWQYMAKDKSKGSVMHKLVKFNKEERTTNDSSAFATAEAAPVSGNGYLGFGSYHKTISHEVPVRSPIFSVFCKQEPDDNRVRIFSRNFSGDGLFLGGLLTSKLQPHQINVKRKPIFKFIDVYEIIDVYARILVEAASIMGSTMPKIVLSENDEDNVTQDLTCPLTFQEFSILVINTLRAICPDQYMVQSLVPVSTGGVKRFVPLTAGVGTIAYGGHTQMLLPGLLKANLLALCSVIMDDSRGGDSNPSLFTPVLGYFPGVGLSSELYAYKFKGEDGEEKTAPMFIDNSSFTARKKKKKCGFIEGVDMETTVSPIDGKSGSKYYNIGSPAVTARYATAFNEYVTRQLSSALLQLDTIGSDPGIASLRSIAITRSVTQVPQQMDELTPYQKRFTKYQEVENEYNTIGICSTVCRGRFYKSLWTQFQQFFVTPVICVTPEEETQYRLRQGEISRIGEITNSIIQDGTTHTLGDVHANLARLNVKMLYSTQSAASMLLEELSNAGEDSMLMVFQKIFAGISTVTNIVKNIIDMKG